MGDFDVAVFAVEDRGGGLPHLAIGGELDAVILAVICIAGGILAGAVELPVSDESDVDTRGKSPMYAGRYTLHATRAKS
jgi:hypothetical protein